MPLFIFSYFHGYRQIDLNQLILNYLFDNVDQNYYDCF